MRLDCYKDKKLIASIDVDAVIDVSQWRRTVRICSIYTSNLNQDQTKEKLMQKYIGIKMIEASPMDRDGVAGYNVIYPDGYASWSPKEAFENAYLPITLESSITSIEIDAIIAEIATQQIDNKTVLVKSSQVTGFMEYDTASCVDPLNFDLEIGKKIAMDKIKSRLWYTMGFVLQWAKYGLKHTEKTFHPIR